MKTFINYLNESINPNDMSEEEQIKYVRQKWKNIRYINNPSEKVQFAAVTEDVWAMKYIDNPSEEIQLMTVKKHIWIIKHIKNPSKEVKRYVINNINFCPTYDLRFIQYIIKDDITKEQYYKAPKDFPWIPEIKEKFKDIDRFKRFNL